MVLRDGRVINTVPIAEAKREELINMMVGRVLDKYYVRTKNEIRDIALEVKGLQHKKLFSDISFQVHYGEIIGFSGLVGAGRTEVMKAVFGGIPHDGGKILLEGTEVKIRKPRDAMEAGIAYVPEDRRGEGLVLLNDVEFNIGLADIKDLVKGIRVRKSKWKKIVDDYVEKFSIKITSPRQKTGRLSGGNQQKVDLAADGAAIIIVSSDLPEIINMCDRTYIMCEGRITGELSAEEFSQEKIMTFSTMTGIEKEEAV